MTHCSACINNHGEENYCAYCGRPLKLNRISGKYVIQELKDILNFKKGFFFTVKELLIGPGRNIQRFLREDRNRIVKPIIFLFFCTLIYTIVEQAANMNMGYIGYQDSPKQTTTTGSLFIWFQNNYGYANLIIGMFISFFTTVFFRKFRYNLFEILVLVSFVLGIGMLIYSFFGVLAAWLGDQLMSFASVVVFIYATWAIGSFFPGNNFVNYLLAFASFVLGFLTFAFSILGIGSLIDQLGCFL